MQKCLDHSLVFGEHVLNHLVCEYVAHYNCERAHSCRDRLPPCQADPPLENNAADPDGIVRLNRLGGLIKTFEGPAA
ncbi:MAG: hypothetical protein IID45_08600 [Planctomycetes bacterium]|nr:hypothetical protein [Planctomycetota bacterium]